MMCSYHCFEHFLTCISAQNKILFYIPCLSPGIHKINCFSFLSKLLTLKHSSFWNFKQFIFCVWNSNFWIISIDSCICSLYLQAFTHGVVFSYLFGDFWLWIAYFSLSFICKNSSTPGIKMTFTKHLIL